MSTGLARVVLTADGLYYLASGSIVMRSWPGDIEPDIYQKRRGMFICLTESERYEYSAGAAWSDSAVFTVIYAPLPPVTLNGEN